MTKFDLDDFYRRAKPKSRLPGLKLDMLGMSALDMEARQTQIPITGTETLVQNGQHDAPVHRAKPKSRLPGLKLAA